MATADLKVLLHEQIDRLDNPEDMQDLLLTVNDFISQRIDPFVETPAFIEQLRQTLTTAVPGKLTSHEQVILESKTWLTRLVSDYSSRSRA